MQKLRKRNIFRTILSAGILFTAHIALAWPGHTGWPENAYPGNGGGVVARATLDGSLHQIAVDSMRTVVDSAFFNPSYGGQLDTSYAVLNQVTLAINESSLLYLRDSFTVSVQMRISYATGKGATDTASVLRTFTINYDSAHSYNSRSSFVFKGGRQVTVKIISVHSSVTTWDPTTVLVVENQLTAKPDFLFDCSNTVTNITVSPSSDPKADELPVSWNTVLGADQYDLEWTYIDSSALADTTPAGVKKYGDPLNPGLIFLNNSTRVSVSGTSYNIPLIYDNTGTLFIRVRPVQVKNAYAVLAATWSSEASTPVMGQYTFRGHERQLNWQANISFAEEGKRKVVVQYYDGSLRSRQTVTKDNTTDTTIVAETYYDYQGRPAIQVMPAPSLSNTIQYTARFNVSINGAEYSQSYYDSLPDNASFCSVHAGPMSSDSGASRYYSPNNPKKTVGLNQFIPDAQDFPFTETEYTPDNTGRISRQGGLGPIYQLGGGHETRYYYGTPSQSELDALFGTEVGDKSHYFKNMVRDANGQYSISYVDMHGRTIATALAGAAPPGMSALSSNVDSTVTETLADPKTVLFQDMSMLTQKSLLVATPDSFQFKYQLDPSSFTVDNCQPQPICYTCRYDLEVTISSDCDNQLLGGQPFDTVLRNFSLDTLNAACSSRKIGLDFSIYLPEGSYLVTKKLTVNKDAYNYYRDSVYIPNNTCTSLEQFVSQQRTIIANTDTHCAPDCHSCRDSLGTWPQYWAKYIQQGGLSLSDRASDSLQVYSAYQDALNACAALCADSLSDADDIRQAMLQDMTPPFGQYADTTKLWSEYSIFYISPKDSAAYVPVFNLPSVQYMTDYNTPDSIYSQESNLMVAPNTLSMEQFVQNFRPSWAEALLPYHPEYCKLLALEAQKPSNVWDRQMEAVDNYQEAVAKGYLNPTANTAAPFNTYAPAVVPDPLSQEGSTYKQQLEKILTSYKPVQNNNFTTTLWGLSVAMVKCSSSDQGCFLKYATAPRPFDTTVLCTGDLDMAWRNFRQLYLTAKQDIVDKLVNNPTGCTPLNQALNNKIPSAATLFKDSLRAEFNEKDPDNAKTGILSQSYLEDIYQANGNKSAADQQKAAINASLDTFYAQNVNALAQQWRKDLAPCNYNDNQMNTVVSALKGLCLLASDSSHPFGASSLPTGANYSGFTSFTGILDHYNQLYSITDTLHCNAEMIKAPAPYYNQPIYSNKPVYSRPSDCECKLITTFYKIYKVSRRTDISFGTYLRLTQQINMADADLTQLLNMCNNKNGSVTTCTWLSKPIYLPPAMQCNSGTTCASCTLVSSIYTSYLAQYPGKTPAISTVDDTVQTQKNVLFQNYMNNRLGFTKQAWEYLQFMDTCAAHAGSISDTVQCLAHSLGNAFKAGTTARFTDVHASTTGGYIMAGSTIPTGLSVRDAYIVNVDDTGAVKWAKTWGGTGDDYFNRVRQTSDNGYIAIGTTRSAQYSNGEIFIVKTDVNGNTRWKRVLGFGTPFGEAGYDIIQTNDGGYAAIGIYNLHSGIGDFLLAKLDTGGTVSWVHQFGASRSDNNECSITSSDSVTYSGTPVYGLLERDDTLLVTGTSYDATMGQRYFGAVYRVDENSGNVIGAWHYRDNSDSAHSCWLGDIYPTANGYLIAVTNTLHLGSDSSQAGVLNISNTGDVLSYHRFNLPSGNNRIGSSTVYPTADGGYLVAQTGISTQHILWHRVDVDDNLLWTKETVLPGAQWMGRLIQNEDVSFTAVGSLDSKAMVYNLPDTGIVACYDSSRVLGRTNPGLTRISWAVEPDRFLYPTNTSTTIGEAVFSPVDSMLACPGMGDCYDFYTGPTLCGKSSPIFASAAADSITTCTDSSFFAVSKGTELYNAYKDSLTGDFEQRYNNICLQAYKYESFTVTHKDREYHYTLYYDQAGNLLKTVPPAGVHKITDTAELRQVAEARAAGQVKVPVHTLASEYRYNTLNQVVAQRTPDAKVSNFWYDRLGRLAISQNARQQPNDQYSYTKYDSIGRVVQVGQLVSATLMQDTISRVEAALMAWEVNAATTADQITVTTYDTAHYGIYPEMTPRNLRNRVAWTALYNTAYLLSIDSANAATHFSYDILGNVDTLVQDFKQGIMASTTGNRHKKIVYDYDLISGKVDHVSYQHGFSDAFYHSYLYDAENRITNVMSSADSMNWDNDAFYSYYAHGPLARTVLGQQQVQGINYVYTLQGWMKAINPAPYTGGTYTLRPDSSGKVVAASAYSLLLNYHDSDYISISGATGPDNGVRAALGGSDYRPLFNGNISSMAMTARKLDNPLLYNYQYDQLNRLVHMDAWKRTGADWSAISKVQDFQENITYDPNGNILTYKRNGNNTFAGKPLAMDEMNYVYKPGTNQLDHINDAVAANNYTTDIDGQDSLNYKYDSIGELIHDNASGISNITWTLYGKIASITKATDTTILYTYDPAGNRISKSVIHGTDTLTTWYVRDVQGNVLSVYTYGDPAVRGRDLTQIELHIYGSTRLGILKTNVDVAMDTPVHSSLMPLLGTGDSLTFKRGDKLFELTNHLGNVLSTISDKHFGVSMDDSTVNYFIPDVVSVQDYYPFGSLEPGRSYAQSGTGYRYGFNGIEKESDLNENNYTTEFRELDTRINRWWTVDPKASASSWSSPYVVNGNNSIILTDPKGDKEYESLEAYKNETGKKTLGKGDWLTSDRKDNTDVWKNANKYNLHQEKGYEEYTNIEQRASFYSWFQDASDAKGTEIRWAGAASQVAFAINELANPTMAGLNVKWVAKALNYTDDQAIDFANTGNRMIFEDVFPKLEKLYDGPTVKGQDAYNWDAMALSQEQNLIQPLYETTKSIGVVSAASKQILAGAKILAFVKGIKIKPFPENGNITDVSQRWAYGMQGMGYKVNQSQMPLPGATYSNGTMYLKFRGNIDSKNWKPNDNRY